MAPRELAELKIQLEALFTVKSTDPPRTSSLFILGQLVVYGKDGVSGEEAHKTINTGKQSTSKHLLL